MARILITGGAGFIGSHTSDALIAAGHKVRILDILDPQIHGANAEFPAYLNPAVESLRGDVRNPNDLERALDGVEAVYHFASLTGVGQSMYDLRSYADMNSTGTAALLECIVKRRVKLQRLVLSSSRAIYGEGTAECAIHGVMYPHARRREDLFANRFEALCPQCGAVTRSRPTAESHPPVPASVYALTKLQQEDYVRYAAETFGLPITILRYFNVYGSRQSLKNPYTGVVSIFYSRLMAGQPISLYEQGLPGRDFVHVSDVVRANLFSLSPDLAPGMCINIGSGISSTIRDVAESLAKATGLRAELIPTTEFRVGDIRSCYADVTRAKNLLNYEPKVGLAEGLCEFVEWACHQKSTDLYEQSVAELRASGLFGQAERKVS